MGQKNTLELPGLQKYCEGETVEFDVLYSNFQLILKIPRKYDIRTKGPQTKGPRT